MDMSRGRGCFARMLLDSRFCGIAHVDEELSVKRTFSALAAIALSLLMPVSAFAAAPEGGLAKDQVTEFMFILILIGIGLMALVAIWEVRKSNRKK